MEYRIEPVDDLGRLFLELRSEGMGRAMPVWVWPALKAAVLALWAGIVWFYLWTAGRLPLAAHCVIRGLFWGIGIVIAFTPAMSASNTDFFPISLAGYARSVEAAGYFHDFFFVTIIAAILGLSDILERFFRSEEAIGIWWRVAFSVLTAYFLTVTVYSLMHFGDLARIGHAHQHVPDATFNHDLNIVYATLLAGLITEIIVVLRERAP